VYWQVALTILISGVFSFFFPFWAVGFALFLGLWAYHRLCHPKEMGGTGGFVEGALVVEGIIFSVLIFIGSGLGTIFSFLF